MSRSLHVAPFRHSRRRLQAIVFTTARIERKSDVWGGSHTGLVPTGQVDLLVPFFVAVNAMLVTPHFSYMLRLAARSERADGAADAADAAPRTQVCFAGGLFRGSARAVGLFWPGCVCVSLPLRCARPSCVCMYVSMGAGWSCMRARPVSMRVVVCVARGGVSRGACCGFGASRVSGVIRRHASVLSVCMHPFLSFSSVGQP